MSLQRQRQQQSSFFFSIPQECRDMVYRLVLESVTEFLESIARDYRAGLPDFLHDRAPTRFLVETDATVNHSFNNNYRMAYTNGTNVTNFRSLSLLRVCSQIYDEAKDLFWKYNTMYYSSPKALEIEYKAISPLAIQRIRSVRVALDMNFWEQDDLDDLAAFVTQTFTQEATSGLRKFELAIHTFVLECIVEMHDSTDEETLWKGKSDPQWYRDYKGLLKCLSSGVLATRLAGGEEEERRIERAIHIDNGPFKHHRSRNLLKMFPQRSVMDTVLGELSVAWEGKIYWDQRLVWDHGVRVNRRGCVDWKAPDEDADEESASP